jgi:hypothetical protein
VSPLAVVEDFDVLEELAAGLSSSIPLALIDQFDFEGGEKLSATALSQQLPLRLMLLWMPWSASSR